MNRAAQYDIGTVGRVVMIELFQRSVDICRSRDGQVCEVGRNLRGSGGVHVGAGCSDASEGSGRGVRFISSQELGREAGVVGEPAVVDSVVEGSVGRRSERRRNVKSEFSILFMTNNNVGGVDLLVRKGKTPDVVARVFGAVENAIVV
jgi:hypothetical protein